MRGKRVAEKMVQAELLGLRKANRQFADAHVGYIATIKGLTDERKNMAAAIAQLRASNEELSQRVLSQAARMEELSRLLLGSSVMGERLMAANNDLAAVLRAVTTKEKKT